MIARALAWGTFLGFFAALFVIPLFALFAQLGDGEQMIVLWDPTLAIIAGTTIGQAALSTVLSVALGLPLGLWVGARAALGAREAWLSRVLLSVPYGIPTVVVGSAFIFWLGRTGPFGWLELGYSMKAVVLAHVFLNIPWIALLVAQARAQLPEEQVEAARTLGAGQLNRLRWVIWPQLKWSVASATAHVFSLCSMSFALVLLLGGGPPVQTLETALYSRVRFGGLDLSGAVACAILQLGITGVPWALIAFAQTGAQSRGRRRMRAQVPRTGARSRNGFGAIAMVAVCSLPLLPYLPLFAPLTRGAGFPISELARPLLISLGLSASAALGSVVVASASLLCLKSLSAHPRLKAAFLLCVSLPSGVSVLVLGLGIWLAYERWFDPFEGSFVMMAALQSMLFLPTAFRALWPHLEGVQEKRLEAARTLGATPWIAFKMVEWPRWKAPLVGATALVAGGAVGELGAVSLFYSETLVPLPLLMSRWLGQYRFEDAQALALLLFLISGAIMLLISVQAREAG